MDYRDRDGYFQEDVFRVLGRSGGSGSLGAGSLSSSQTIFDESSRSSIPPTDQPPSYEGFRRYNLADMDTKDYDSVSTTSTETSTTSEATFSENSSGPDEEWEEAKQVLHTAFVGFMIPFICRYIGRRLTLSVWTRFLTSYFGRR